MNSVSIFTILFCLEISKSNTLDYPLIRDYLQWKNLRVILFVTCENTYNGHINESIDYFQSNDIWINHYDISNKKNQIDLSYEHYFVRLSYQYLVVMNLECNYTNTFLNEISKRKMFHFERSWLIFARNTKQINNVLSKENVNVDADIMTAVPIGEKQLEYKIYDIYNPSHERNGKLKMENVGTWSRTWLMKMNETETKFEKRNDFGGLTFLSVITIPSIPKNKTFLEHIDSDEYPHLDSLNKNIYRVFQLLMQMFNFKMAVRRAKIWGYLQGNGSWVGAIGLINRSEIDICLSGLRWEDERYGAFDQTTHAYFAQLSFIFRHPKSSNMTNVFLAPFDIEVWWLILTVGLVFSLTARHIFSVEKEINKIVFNVKNESSFGNSFLMVFGMLFQQGYCGKTLLFSSRILATTTLMLSLCVYQFYGSFIVGSLLTDPPKTIKTIKGLLNSRLEVAIDEVPYILDNFKRVKEASVIQLYNEVMKKPNPFLPVYRAMLTDKEVCSLQTLKYGPVIPAGPGLPTKSPLREIVKIGIRKIAETGIMGYHWRIWIGHPPKCTNSHIDVMSINISHFSSAIYILVFGIQLSLCILIGEIILRYFIYWKLVNQKKKGTSENRL